MVYAFGTNGGWEVMGLLFSSIGPKTTLFCYSIASAIILIGLVAYIHFAKDLDDYEKHSEDKDVTSNSETRIILNVFFKLQF